MRLVALVAVAIAAAPAHASFHFMQIEQVVGGVGGDVTQQAVQLRMRAPGQNLVQFSRVRAYDANGSNPVLLHDFTSQLINGLAGDRVLIATAAFAQNQGLQVDGGPAFLIPPAYFAGGRITFEGDDGSVLYSLCWGNYAGPSTGSFDNDDDGQYGPCEPGPLPTSTLQALRFGGSHGAVGTSNAADFALTSGAAVFTNNGRNATTLRPLLQDTGRGGDCDDTEAGVFPGQAEVAGNRRDDDCDGLADESPDNIPSADTGDVDVDGQSIAGGDCNDANAAVRSGADEVAFDLLDNDCDGEADESATGAPAIDPVDHDLDGRAVYDRVYFHDFEEPLPPPPPGPLANQR